MTPLLPLLRRAGLALALLAAAAWVLSLFTDVRPLATWFLPHFLLGWAGMAVFGAASYAVGRRALQWLSPGALQSTGGRVLAFATGVFIFVLGNFLFGLAGSMGPLFFFCWPALLLASGLDALASEALRFWRWVDTRRFTAGDLLWVGLGGLLFAALYLPVLSPENLNYDARVYHVAHAERYAALGRIAAFPEGSLIGAYPQLTIFLNLWPFAMPFGSFFDKLTLCMHLELLLVLATVASIPSLVRVLAPSLGTLPGAALAFFLFPSIFIYDTGLQGGAEHVAAFWVVPAWLALRLTWRSMGARGALLVAIPISGLILTKYSAVVAVVPLVLAVAARLLWQLVRRDGRALRAVLSEPLAVMGWGLLLTAPHWLKNWLYYGDPTFPMLHRIFGAKQWTRDSEAWFTYFMATSPVPKGSAGHNALEALKSLADYSYSVTYNWSDMHGPQPAFGSLFTACLLALLLVKGAKRLWPMVGLIHVGLFVWFYMSCYERYLVVFVPWMAAVVSVCAALAWRQGGAVVRIAVVAFIASQVVGQADLPFIPAHRMNGKQPVMQHSIDLLGAGYRNDALSKLSVYSDWQTIGRALPLDATVLVHQWPLRLGIARNTMDDMNLAGQFGISYSELGDVAAIDQKLKALGATHVAYADSIEDLDSLGGELLFQEYARLSTVGAKQVQGWNLARLPDEAPKPGGKNVLVIGCGNPYRTGLYDIGDLSVPRAPPGQEQAKPAPRKESTDLSVLMAEADHLVIDRSCAPHIDTGQFKFLAHRKAAPAMELYSRATARN